MTSGPSLRQKKSFSNLNVGLSSVAAVLPSPGSSITANLMLRTHTSHMLSETDAAISPAQPETKQLKRKTNLQASRIPRPVINRSPSSSSSTYSGLSFSGTDRRLSACTTPPTSPSVTSYARPTHASNNRSIDHSDSYSVGAQRAYCPPPRRVLVRRAPQRDSISSLGTSYETPDRSLRTSRLDSSYSLASTRSRNSDQQARPMSYAAGMTETPEYAALSRYGGLGVVVEGGMRSRPNLGHQSSAVPSECASVPESYMSMEEVRLTLLIKTMADHVDTASVCGRLCRNASHYPEQYPTFRSIQHLSDLSTSAKAESAEAKVKLRSTRRQTFQPRQPLHTASLN